MSIIHDALKKVQQGLSPENQTASAYLYEKPAEVETLPRANQQATNQKSLMKNKIKSLFILCCALAITLASVLYIYQQFQNDIPKVKNFAKKSFYKLINKEEPLAFKAKAPDKLKPLAQFTINPPASSKITKPPAPITLNIHGIMSNDTGNLVLINDQVYQEGDAVDGAKIVKINLDSITVNINGAEKTIFVKN